VYLAPRGSRARRLAALLLAGIFLAAVVQSAAASQARQRHIPTLPGPCQGIQPPCHFRKGRFQLGPKTDLPGLRLTLPRGWSSTENDQGELNLIPAGHPDDHLFVWTDLAAVKSTGPGHGTTVLTKIGKTPGALIAWLTSNPDFQVVSPPRATKIARRIRTRTLTVGVSTSANYGSSECPSNPRCADLFTKPPLWGPNFYGIGYPELVQLSLATIKRGTHKHTVIVALDAVNARDLAALRKATHSVTASFWLPKAIK
jgi:hypothetical protein